MVSTKIKNLGNGSSKLRTFVVGATDRNDSVLLFLHGRGEASAYENELPKVAFHLSPVFQALTGALQGITVVGPQAPHSPQDSWNWADYAKIIGEVLVGFKEKGRTILASGFSRGGLGVLQIMHSYPGLVSKWAIIDPQAPQDKKEENNLLSAIESSGKGWLRYGPQYASIREFSKIFETNTTKVTDINFVDMGHGELALEAFKGRNLGGQMNMYKFLGVKHSTLITEWL